MYTETVVLGGHTQKSGNNNGRAWTLNIWKDQQNREFRTFDTDVAAQVFAAQGQPLAVTFEAKQRGQYTNYEITSVQTNGAVAPAPVAAAPAPTQEAAPPPQQTTSRWTPETELAVKRQSALQRAIMAFGVAGEDPLVNHSTLLELADTYVDYFENGRASEVVEDETQIVAGPVA